MGEVYRARDVRLRREVALKILPQSVCDDPERLLRFEQEAQAAALLTHPNVVAIHDIGRHDGVPYIVTELLNGETLRAQLVAARVADPGARSQGRGLPVRRTIAYAVQIASGLAALHDRGIVHRDLKPENVIVTDDGHVKILDFGLAKVTRAPGLLHSEARTEAAGTQPGAVLGTIGYMAPEQVRGQPADHRADIFAFGAILYEMLCGARAFEAESTADTMTAILKEQPAPLTTTLPELSPALARIVDRCLEKRPGERFQSALDLRFALEGLATPSGTSAAHPMRVRGPRQWLPWAVAGVAVAGMAASAWLAVASYRRPHDLGPVVRFHVVPPGDVAPTTSGVAVSPDGRQLAFTATDASGVPLLWVRALDSLEARSLPGTDGARQPFWSPDSRHIGFFAPGSLIKRVAVDGGPPQTISDGMSVLTTANSGAWNRNGVILFSGMQGPIYRLSAAGGGQATPVTSMERPSEERHLFPCFLPDGQRFLYFVRGATPETSGIYLKSMDAGDARLVLRGTGSNVVYVPTGFILYGRDGVVMAQPFDANRGTTTGDAFSLAERIDQTPETDIAVFSASETGALVYRGASDAALSRLLWFDRTGKASGEVGEPNRYRNPRLSPDYSRVAVEIVDRTGNRDIWVMDVARGIPARFTFDPGRDASPVWSPDGSQIAWQGAASTHVRPSTGAGSARRLRSEPWILDDWLPDATGLLVHSGSPTKVSLLPLVDGGGEVRPVIEGRRITSHARVSPDGRWVAFANADSDRFEIYLQDFPAGAGKWQVSTGGGVQPKWRPDGKELFYLSLDGRLMAVPVTLGAIAEIGKPQVLFQTRVDSTMGQIWHQYDVMPGGQRFLVNTQETVTAPVTVVLNWPALVRR